MTPEQQNLQLLTVPRDKVTEAYTVQIARINSDIGAERKRGRACKELLDSLFGSDCLPDSDLAPYTEPEPRQTEENMVKSPQLKDNMEEKELNLATLLKGCEGEIFYSPNYGEVTLKAIKEYYLEFSLESGSISIAPSTLESQTGFVGYYPSKEAFLKYPLEAAKAWQEWQEGRKPKIWRAKPGEVYYWITGRLIVESDYESRSQGDDELYIAGNCFRNRELAQEAASQIRELLTKFHEQHQKV